MIVLVKRKSLFFFLMVLLICFSATNFIYGRIREIMLPFAGQVIIIDPGHGGRDPGAVGKNGKSEKDINLNISKMLKKQLEHSGYLALLTREKDEEILEEGAKWMQATELRARKKIIDEAKPKMLISIHLNSFPDPREHGAQVFYAGDFPESKRLGETIQSELKSMIDPENNREAKPTTSLLVLKKLNAPAVLVECGFLSNHTEELKLANEDYQDKLARAIFSGVIKFYTQPQVQNSQTSERVD